MNKQNLVFYVIQELLDHFGDIKKVEKRDLDMKEILKSPQVFSYPACFVSYAGMQKERAKQRARQFERTDYIKLNVAFQGFYKKDNLIDLELLDKLEEHFDKLAVPGYDCCTVTDIDDPAEAENIRIYTLIIELKKDYYLG